MEGSTGCSGGDPLYGSRGIAADRPSRSGILCSIVAWTWLVLFILEHKLYFNFCALFSKKRFR
jgi:hypothetical protein